MHKSGSIQINLAVFLYGCVRHKLNRACIFFVVYDGYCKKCEKVFHYDGLEDGILRMNNYLIHHRVLRNYMTLYLTGNRLVLTDCWFFAFFECIITNNHGTLQVTVSRGKQYFLGSIFKFKMGSDFLVSLYVLKQNLKKFFKKSPIFGGLHPFVVNRIAQKLKISLHKGNFQNELG